MSQRRLLLGILIGLFVLDTAYSFLLYYRQPLDGDLAWNILPDPGVATILQDPLGLGVWTDGATYPNPNRFFCHWLMRTYFLHVPLWLQGCTDPVTSIYLASALVKILVHVVLLYLLSALITGRRYPLNVGFSTALCLLFPLMQSHGYRSYMGVVDPSVTYTFFYALPAAFLLVYLGPFVRWWWGRPVVFRWWRWLLWLPLGVVVCLSGPLNPGAVGVLAILVVGQQLFGRGRRMPRELVMLGVWLTLWAGYSLLLGQYNSLTIENPLPLAERYARLPAGIAKILTGKLGYGLLIALLFINWIIGRITPVGFGKVYRYALAFSVLYVLLLPLGGYRAYRDLIVRYDTIIPVTLALFGLYGYTSLRLLRSPQVGRWYLFLPTAAAVVYTLADKPQPQAYICERDALYELARSPADTVVFTTDCSTLSWGPIEDPAASGPNAQLLRYWRVTDEVRYYRNLLNR